MFAVALAIGTFVTPGSMVSAFIDNDGVLGSVIKGSSKSPETNLAVGKMWLDLASNDVGFYAARVESKANISDGPSRLEFGEMAWLGATYVEPSLSSWALEVWAWP